MISFKKISSLFFSLLAGLFATKIYWQTGFPYTHDGANHLARFVNYAASLREGQFPPRFAPYIFSGFGFPVFNYNYPLENIMAAPFIWLDLNPERVFALLLTGFLSLGVWSVYSLLRKQYSTLASSVGVIIFFSSSYLINALVYRGGIGEIAAYCLVPWTAWQLWQWRERSTTLNFLTGVVSLAALWLSHNVLAIIVAPLLVLWSVSLYWGQSKLWKKAVLMWILSFGLVVWFWAPAVLELNLIALSGNTLTTEAKDHALTLSQLLFSPWRFGFSRIGPLDSLGFGLGAGALATIFLGLCLFAKKVAHREVNRWETTGALLIAGSAFLSLAWSSWLWTHLPVLPLFQFPWRLLVIAALLLPVAAAWLYQQAGKWLRLVLLCAVVLQAWQFWKLKPVDRFHAETGYYLSFPHTTTTRNENRPETWKIDTLPAWSPQPTIASGEGEISVQIWLGSRRSYTVRAKTDLLITEPTVFFPGWETKEGNRLVPNIFTDETKGLIAYTLPAREEPYLITTAFSGRTKVRVLSEVVSGMSLIVVIGALTKIIWRKRK